MSSEEKFASVKIILNKLVAYTFQIVAYTFQKVAGLFGYPNRLGMTVEPLADYSSLDKLRFLDSLPRHTTSPAKEPPTENWFDLILGGIPKLDTIQKHYYQRPEEGFYNFYIQNYKNLLFLPDELSEFLQINLNICTDTNILETTREVLFVILIVYSQMMILRLTLYWFLIFNPYAFPWRYLSAIVDWTEEIAQGVVPSIFGFNLAGTLFLGVLGMITDDLNHLVFTMPFLPSEGEEVQMLINQELKEVIVFHYLPVLWYRYPIPEDLREFWFYERPEILHYLQKFYSDLNIDFYPDLHSLHFEYYFDSNII